MQQAVLVEALSMGSTGFAVSFAIRPVVLISTWVSLAQVNPLPMWRKPLHAVNGDSVAHSLVRVPSAACA